MPGFPLYQCHDQAYCAELANIEQAVAAQATVLVGAPGSTSAETSSTTRSTSRNYVESGVKRLACVGGVVKSRSYTVS